MSDSERMREAEKAVARTLDLWSDDALREEIDGHEMAKKVIAAALPFLGGLPPKPNGLTQSGDAMQSAVSRMAEWIGGADGVPYEVEMAALEAKDAIHAWTEARMVDACPSGCPPKPSELNSGQWCTVHDCHQDDPKHDYRYSCEGHMRDATAEEDARVEAKLAAGCPPPEDEK